MPSTFLCFSHLLSLGPMAGANGKGKSTLLRMLAGYGGALMVVSHHGDFLAQLGITRVVDVSGYEV